MTSVTRKAFLVQLVQGVGGGWMLAACGGGGSSPPPVGGGGGGGCTASIAGNHGHVLSIPAADLNSAVDMTYDIFTATAGHSHIVTFTVAMLGLLKAGNMVNVTSTTGGTPAHNHAISELCT